MSLPHLPGRFARLPQRLQTIAVAKRIHALPESLMPERRELSLCSETLQRIALQHCLIPIQILENLRLEHEEATVDPAFLGLRFFLEVDHLVTVELHGPEARRWPHGT